MNRILCTLLLAFGGLLQAAERPNILMIAVDDLNDWVGFLGGHPQTITPNLDRLANQGVNFTNAHCPAPGCSPSRNAILLGAEPVRSGLYPFYNLNHVEPEALEDFYPMPLFFRDNGYTTVGLNKVWHNPDNQWRRDEQWDIYRGMGDNDLKLIPEKGYHPVPFNKRTVSVPASNPVTDFQDRKITDFAVDFLNKPQEKPFFLAVGYIKPHAPFIMPEANFDRFDFPIEPPPFRADDLNDIPLAGRSNAQIYVEIPLRRDNAWEDVRRGYLACVNFIDDNVGLLLDALENSPHADNTIVVLWSDHGFHLGEKRTFSKFSLWEEATRTPFIIYDPRGRAGNGQRVGEAVSLINLYRTLADLAGLEPPDDVDGVSLVPWLDNPELEKPVPAMTTWGRGNYTLRTRDWRYTRYFDGSEELYQHSVDPNEWTNLADRPEHRALMDGLARFLPTKEAPQVTSGRELYNVADKDKPEDNIRSYERYVREYQELGLEPPLD